MKSTLPLILILFAFCVAPAYPDSAVSDSFSIKFRNVSLLEYKNYLGYTQGVSFGTGLSYRRWINEMNGFQFALGPIRATDINGDNLPAVYATIAPLVRFPKISYFRIVGYASASGVFIYKRNDSYKEFWVGAGGGLEVSIWRFCSVMTIGGSTLKDENPFDPSFGIYYRF